uniref:(northern house mosquito) hypothetical protein n=1 Tax=Culex pipiens TaxID=7175 RepID=A0A8D8D535_CULPI
MTIRLSRTRCRISERNVEQIDAYSLPNGCLKPVQTGYVTRSTPPMQEHISWRLKLSLTLPEHRNILTLLPKVRLTEAGRKQRSSRHRVELDFQITPSADVALQRCARPHTRPHPVVLGLF